ncbi:2-dehydropantoate 2-reductase (Ketopantoate reductase) (KPA reductase) (KPR) [Podospora pseudocomata]|uniref:2-dehydropantoate 2-reductase (Ketopantoate reductase) (KPA reductase) (KPR) n=1 Tax=Podospora pseudocomata TaxID=2093779 RepID=A0ABR0GUF0_9PEZI|nr:2-dehydropantoate 2-reductase (Ketopantoate reductase) (KPA reductase) (KPR) [Podospora pseudocomata]
MKVMDKSMGNRDMIPVEIQEWLKANAVGNGDKAWAKELKRAMKYSKAKALKEKGVKLQASVLAKLISYLPRSGEPTGQSAWRNLDPNPSGEPTSSRTKLTFDNLRALVHDTHDITLSLGQSISCLVWHNQSAADRYANRINAWLDSLSAELASKHAVLPPGVGSSVGSQSGHGSSISHSVRFIEAHPASVDNSEQSAPSPFSINSGDSLTSSGARRLRADVEEMNERGAEWQDSVNDSAMGGEYEYSPSEEWDHTPSSGWGQWGDPLENSRGYSTPSRQTDTRVALLKCA